MCMHVHLVSAGAIFLSNSVLKISFYQMLNISPSNSKHNHKPQFSKIRFSE